jgi:hypothetical protein
VLSLKLQVSFDIKSPSVMAHSIQSTVAVTVYILYESIHKAGYDPTTLIATT